MRKIIGTEEWAAIYDIALQKRMGKLPADEALDSIISIICLLRDDS